MAISHNSTPKAESPTPQLVQQYFYPKVTRADILQEKVIHSPHTSDLIENLLYARLSGAVHLIGNLAPA